MLDDAACLAELQRLRALVAQQQQELELFRCELHDGLLQFLVAAHMQCEAARRELERREQPVPSSLVELRDQLQVGMQEGRRLLDGLRPLPVPLDELPRALRALGEPLPSDRPAGEATTCWEIDVSLPAELNSLQARTLYRIAQEAVQNVRRHSHARHGRVSLWYSDREIGLDVEDDGQGFDPAQVAPGHFGLVSMQRRAAIAGGTCQVTSAPGAGTRVGVRLPRVEAADHD
jgi:signal transduction histidine kinase